MASKFFVSRQHYYYSGEFVVEVVHGGIDYAGADMFTVQYRNFGEGQEYTDPRQAVESAIEIKNAWQLATTEKISVAVGSTGGMGIELEPCSDDEAKAWAEERYNELPRCACGCGEILSADETWISNYGGDEDEFYSEACVERYEQALRKTDINWQWDVYQDSELGSCPVCLQGRISAEGYDPEKNSRVIVCHACGHRFYEVMAVIGIGMVDENGDWIESDSVDTNTSVIT